MLNNTELKELQFWRRDLQGPDGKGTKRIHFPSMLFEFRFASTALGAETYRLFHIRRQDGLWERALTKESLELELAEPTFMPIDEIARRRASSDENLVWEPYRDATVEYAYQRLLSALGVEILPVEGKWREEEARHLARIRGTAVQSRSAPSAASQPGDNSVGAASRPSFLIN